MKKFRTVALVLAAVLMLPLSAKSAEVNDPNATDEPPAVTDTATPDDSAVQTGQGDSQAAETPAPAGDITTQALPDNTSVQSDTAPGPLKLPNANPAYTIELANGAFNVTYPNHETAAHDKKYIPLIINGTLIDSEVLLINDRTMAPLRVLTEALGGTVDWDDATRTVTIHKDGNTIQMTIGDTTVKINGVETTIDVPPDIYNDLTYLPIRFVAQTLGAVVSYNTGEYDSSTMTYKSYMLVQGVTANATIDQYDPSWPADSPQQAQFAVMAASKQLFDEFVQQNDANNPDKDFTSKYNFIQYNIDHTRVVGSVSRYYAVESFCLFLYDKYTGYIYTVGSDSTSNWVRRYAQGDPQNMKLITDTYFFN